MEKQQVMQIFRDLEMSLHRTVLNSAVDREANIDKYLQGNIEKQNSLKRSIRGLTILHYFAFLQSNIEKKYWRLITCHDDKKRGDYPNINWDFVDIFYYIRNCYAHRWQGQIFPLSQLNTKLFMKLIKKPSDLSKLVLVKDNIIHIETTLICFNLIYSLLETFLT